MSIGFKSGGGMGQRKGPRGGDSAEGLDKIDMSLDDIIKLNRKEQNANKPGPGNHKLGVNSHFPQGKRVGSWPGGPAQRGGGIARLGVRGRKVPPPAGRRRGQGVITGLAARRTATLRKGISPLNRPASLSQKPRPLLQRRAQPYRQLDLQRRPYRQMDTPRGPNMALHRPIQLRRRPMAPTHQVQRDARQATFLFRRGLKVHTQVESPNPAPVTHRMRPWRTSTTSSGILTVSIDNPTARTQPEPPRAWSLHPPIPAPPTEKLQEEVRKPPKGVPLQFDINSVGKQTAMTLNERFRMLKDRRAAVAQGAKGSRFVTVG